jgi:very-short-patch-repair endonuclease
VEFDRFYRDSTPDEYLVNFKDEIYHGVVEIHGDHHANGLARLSQVMQRAAILQPSGILGRHAGTQVKQGTCHQFANEGRLPWHR